MESQSGRGFQVRVPVCWPIARIAGFVIGHPEFQSSRATRVNSQLIASWVFNSVMFCSDHILLIF